MVRLELFPESGVAREIGEADRELNHVQRRRGRADVAVATADRLQMMAMHRVDGPRNPRQHVVDDGHIRTRDVKELPLLGEGRLDVRTHQRDLGFGDASDGLTDRAHELQHLFLGDERGEQSEESEHLDVVATEAPFEGPRIGKPSTPPEL